MTPNTPSELIARLKMRKALPVATAALAAASLAGCGMLPAQNAAAPAPTPVQQEATRRVQSFTTDIDQALDKVDRDRLRLAAQQQAKAAPATAPAAAPISAAVTPAIAAPAVEASQAPVILASSTGQGISAPPANASKPPALITAEASDAPAAPAVKTPAPVADATPKTTSAAKDAPPATPLKTAALITGSAAITAAPAPAERGSAIITPIAPVTATSASAMGSMTAMLVTPQAPAQMAAMAPVAPAAIPAEPTMDQALAVIRKGIADHPTLTTALAVALLDNGATKSASTADPAQGLNDNDKKILTDLLAAFDAMKTQSPESAATLADRAAPLIDAEKKWQSDADLSLPKLVLASRVDSFGVYTPIDPKFEQGKRHTVIIYCEVANFSAKKGDDGWFTTDLEQQETLITEDGLLIWRPNAEEISDRSMNQRHDFYLVKKLTIPENLAAGKYTLRMSVVDKNDNKRSMVSMPIEIAGG